MINKSAADNNNDNVKNDNSSNDNSNNDNRNVICFDSWLCFLTYTDVPPVWNSSCASSFQTRLLEAHYQYQNCHISPQGNIQSSQASHLRIADRRRVIPGSLAIPPSDPHHFVALPGLPQRCGWLTTLEYIRATNHNFCAITILCEAS